MTGDEPRRSHRRTAVAVVLLVTLLAGLGAALRWRRELLRRALIDALVERGIAPAELEVSWFGLRQVTLRDVTLGDTPDLLVEHFEADLSASELARFRLDEVRMDGAALRARIGADGLSIGALDVLLEPGAEGELPILPTRRAILESGRADVETPFGAAHLTGAGRVAEEVPGVLDAAFEFALEHELGRARGGLEAEGPLDALVASAWLEPELARDALLPGLSVAPFRAETEVRVNGSDLAVDLALPALAGRYQSGDLDVRLVPLDVTAALELREAQLDYEVRVADASGLLDLTARGTADPASGEARATLLLAPLHFEPGAAQPEDLSPQLAEWITEASGAVEGRAVVTLSDAGPSLVADVVLRELGFATELAEVSGVTGRVQLAGPPLHTPGRQQIAIRLVDIGLPLVAGLIDFELRRDGILDLHRAEWHWADGVLSTGGKLDPASERQHLSLAVDSLDVTELLQWIDLAGLDGTGRVSGTVPVHREGDVLRVRGAELRATGGVLQYQPEPGAAAAVGGAQGMGTLLAALENFQYDELVLRLDGDLQGEMQVAVRLLGSNPDFQSGRKVDFNLNVEAHLADLVRAGQAGVKIPKKIEEQLRAYEQEKRGGG